MERAAAHWSAALAARAPRTRAHRPRRPARRRVEVGFARRAPSDHPVPDRLGPILEEAVPLYERLLEFAV